MAISLTELAWSLQVIRPRLVHSIQMHFRCDCDEAEDIVSDAVLAALNQVGDFDENTGVEGLCYRLIARALLIGNHRVRAAAALDAAHIRADAKHAAAAQCEIDLWDAVEKLPMSSRLLFTDWLAGYSHEEIAHRHSIHRNTIAGRLEEAFARLREAFPNEEAFEYSYALFAACSRVTVYRKPAAAWLPWNEQHPPDFVFPAPRPT